jgi:hypothetical protein
MIIGISQPTLFPWIGYFDIIKKVDFFVFLDNVKFEKSSWQMRNRIKTITKSKDDEVWIRVPTKDVKNDTIIKDVLIDNNQNWRKKHQITFENNYGSDIWNIDFLKEMYKKEWKNLVDFNIEFITKCCKFLEIDTKLLRSSQLSAYGKKSNLVLNICKELKATEYMANQGSKGYLEKDKKLFEDENIEISYHSFLHPVYKQKGFDFMENLSVLDLIFNENKNAKKIFEISQI